MGSTPPPSASRRPSAARIPQSFGQFETGGYETIRAWDYPGNAQRIAEEAAQLLGAAECPEGEKTLILEGSQLALQIHESVGHAIELDRILGLGGGLRRAPAIWNCPSSAPIATARI